MHLALFGGMNASRHWDDRIDATFERRASRHHRAYRRAQIRAARRATFWEELARYCAITLLLLWIVRPIGIVVGICWGLLLWRRYSNLELLPRLRERWTERELERDGPRARARRRGAPTRAGDPRSDARDLLVHVGDDPESSENLELARDALAATERIDDTTPMRTGSGEATHAEVNVADVLEETLSKLGKRMRRAGVRLSVEFDSAGRIRADVGQLRTVFHEVLESALDSLEAARKPEPQIEVAMGENLARTQVWVRIRHNGSDLGSRDNKEIILSKNGEERA